VVADEQHADAVVASEAQENPRIPMPAASYSPGKVTTFFSGDGVPSRRSIVRSVASALWRPVEGSRSSTTSPFWMRIAPAPSEVMTMGSL
jgi:hypothetical protein